jgi:hypothetical protein
LAEAKAHGARAALFGRKINNAEHQLSFIQFLRWIADGEIGPEEAVKAYHGVLQGLGIKPNRSLADDMQLTEQAVGYSGSTRTFSIPPAAGGVRRVAGADSRQPAATNGQTAYPTLADGMPDFARMTPDQRLAYHIARLDRSIG